MSKLRYSTHTLENTLLHHRVESLRHKNTNTYILCVLMKDECNYSILYSKQEDIFRPLLITEKAPVFYKITRV